MLLFELFTTVYPYAIETNTENKWIAKFWDPKELVPVRFVAIPTHGKGSDQWNVGFARGRETSATGQGNAYKIFSTVIAVFKKFLQDQQPAFVTFTADEVNRQSLYKKMIAQMANEVGYALADDYDTGSEIELRRIT